jgi:guanine deaminase
MAGVQAAVASGKERMDSVPKSQFAPKERAETTARTASHAIPEAEMLVHESFMRAAAMSAVAGVRLGHGGPFGASIVRDGVIVACAHNMVLHRGDPCCHAEMNAISQACRALGTHDLSDCNLYTTCEPCPMCWGAVQWSRLGTAYLGVDRHTAAKYGFDDKVFYDEVGAQADGSYKIRQSMSFVSDLSTTDTASDGSGPTAEEEHADGMKPSMVIRTAQSSPQAEPSMIRLYNGLLEAECRELFTNPQINKTLKRRFGSMTGSRLQEKHRQMFPALPSPEAEQPFDSDSEIHEKFMRRAIQVAIRGTRDGLSKEREPFAAVIVRDGEILGEACNTTTYEMDATATAEVNAIRAATQRLGSYNLQGCDIYCTSHPDLMSLGAILWSRISRVYCGVSLQVTAQYGFEETLMNLADLLDTESGKRVTETVEGVAKDACEAVFKEWSERNGKIY